MFSVIPRKDTNAIAHRLIGLFGNITKVFEATAEELMTVEGVGKRVAGEIVALGRVLQIIKSKENSEGSIWYSVHSKRDELIALFKNQIEEKFVLVLLNGKRKEITKLGYEDKNKGTVSAEIPEIAKAIALHKPKFAIMLHNHPSSNPLPSEFDDIATMKINLLCSMHGVNLSDHVIVAGEELYSYHLSGRMDYIKSTSDLDKLLLKEKE